VTRVERLDRYQRRHRWLGLPLAVIYKFFDDRGPHLAALVTYYAFVSLFPLLLLLFSALAFFLQGHPDVRQDVQQALLRNFPTIGPDLKRNIETIHGSGIALSVGVLGTLYGGLGAMQAAQASFNLIWGVPRNKQPNPLRSRLRSLALVLLLGSGVIVSTGGAAILSTANGISRQVGPAIEVGGYLLNYAISIALFVAAFRVLTALPLRVRQVLPGAAISAGGWIVLQILGSSFIAQMLTNSNALYGVFAVVLATLAWFYLQSVIVMLAAEVNVVRLRRLWPRALLTPFTDDVELTPADRQAYAMYAATQRFKGFEQVTTDFARPATTDDDPEAHSERLGA
jgi:YihY family inner membrane protein